MIAFHKPYLLKEFYKETCMRYENTAESDLFQALESEADARVESALRAVRGYEKIPNVYWTHSATHALEIMALALELGPEDEVILPSFTYVATANAFARTGARLVFADIEPDTLNLDPKSVERVMGSRTRAIIPIHYGGVAADLSGLAQLAKQSGAWLLEDAAHCIGSRQAGIALGGFGAMGCLSFHKTKNISSNGSGGCLMLSDTALKARVDEIFYQGTDRAAFLRGETTAYKWKRIGGDFDMPALSKLYLAEALRHTERVNDRRKQLWRRYAEAFVPLVEKGVLRTAKIDAGAEGNGHIFYIQTRDVLTRRSLKAALFENGIETVTHYEPLHLTGIGRKIGRAADHMTITEDAGETVLRLPIYPQMTDSEQEKVISEVYQYYRKRGFIS
jgi:dTDP-4-amino-4,6-dideoxygalactose transaminase